MRYKSILIVLIISFNCLACGGEAKEAVKSNIPTVQILPQLRLHSDTVDAGDSLITSLSIVYQPMLSYQLKKEYITSLGYYLDTASGVGYPKQVTDFTYRIEPDISVDSIRFSFIPSYKNTNKDIIVKRDFTAAVKIGFPKVGNTTIDTTFMDKKTYYTRIKKKN